MPTAYHRYEVQKIADLKFMECPGSSITRRTWQILGLVNESCDTEGNIRHLPFSGTLLDQPLWFREAVKIVRAERHSDWNRELQEERAKAKSAKRC